MADFDDSGLYQGKYKGWMETYGGRKVNPFNVRGKDVDIQTIVHALSLICRFGGHCKAFYSVAEHSVRTSELVKPEYRLAALLHDAAEAYLGDVIRPLKYNLPVIQEAEEEALKTIMDAFGVDFSEEVRAAVRLADNIMVATEGRDLMYKVETWGNLPEPLKTPVIPMSSQRARNLFLVKFYEYGGKDGTA